MRAGFPLRPEAQAGLDEVARDLEGVVEEIRIFSQGLHPALLARSGLGPSLRALARRSPIPRAPYGMKLLGQGTCSRPFGIFRAESVTDGPLLRALTSRADLAPPPGRRSRPLPT